MGDIMAKELGLPYMGSKRKISKDIVDYILQHNPNAKYVYDLFGGGGAMSFEFLQRKQIKKVVYNELNTGITELLKKIRTDGITPEFYKWIDRDTFNTHKNDETWFGGLLRTVWCFGNNQRPNPPYIFGVGIEEPKRLLHEIIVNRCNVSRLELQKITGLFIEDNYLAKDDIQARRFEVMRLIKAQIGRFDLEQLQNLQQLQISNKSYLDVAIDTPIAETIIYLDPPYQGTATYAKDISHDTLLEYCKNSPYKIYVSSYEFDLPMVWQKFKRCTLSATANNKATEKLFCNQPETVQGALF